MESCPSGRRCSTRNAVDWKVSRVRIPNSPPPDWVWTQSAFRTQFLFWFYARIWSWYLFRNGEIKMASDCGFYDLTPFSFDARLRRQLHVKCENQAFHARTEQHLVPNFTTGWQRMIPPEEGGPLPSFQRSAFSTARPDARKYLPWWKYRCVPATPIAIQ